jgi:hypothetical protein
MSINYNMNHIYYYEKSNWDFYRRGQFKHLPIPALTLGFPITPILKPWYWHPYLFLQVHWTWQFFRSQLDEDWGASFWLRVLFVITLVGLIEWKSGGVNRYAHDKLMRGNIADSPLLGGGVTGNNNSSNGNSDLSSSVLPLPALLYPLSVLGAKWASILFGLFSVLLSFWVALRSVPAMMPPNLALPLFSFVEIALVFAVFLRLFHALYACPTPARSSMAIMALTSFIIQLCGFYVMNGDYSNPVSKIWSILLTIQAVIGIQVYYFIKCGKVIYSQLRRFGNHNNTLRALRTSDE